MNALPDWPVLQIEAGGSPLARPDAAALSYAIVRQALGVSAAAELDFLDPGPGLIETMAVGAALVLQVRQDVLFRGRVARTELAYDNAGGVVLRVRAYDALHAARLRRVPARREDTSAATLGAEIAARIGLGFQCDATPGVHKLVFQLGQSDLELLATLAGEEGLYPCVTGTDLVLFSLDGRPDELELQLGRNLHAVTLSASDEQALRRAQARGWRSDTLETFNETAGLARQDAFEMHGVAFGGGDESAVGVLLNRIVDDRPQALALAQAALDRAAAAEAAAEGMAEGDPNLQPGRPVQIQGAAPRYCGRYVVTQAVHRFDTLAGYTTSFSTAPPPLRERDRAPVVTYGRVSSIDDPNEAGRCRVVLEQFGGLETGWLQSVVAGAGKGRGLASLAETQDAVLIVLPDGDPAHGFMLGGLYGSERLPRGLGGKQRRPYVLRTGGGHGLELGRDTAVARLFTASGNVVELTPARVRIASVSDLVIEAPGKTITIRADAISFEQG